LVRMTNTIRVDMKRLMISKEIDPRSSFAKDLRAFTS
jgi:hypothetical protein